MVFTDPSVNELEEITSRVRTELSISSSAQTKISSEKSKATPEPQQLPTLDNIPRNLDTIDSKSLIPLENPITRYTAYSEPIRLISDSEGVIEQEAQPESSTRRSGRIRNTRKTEEGYYKKLALGKLPSQNLF